MATRRIQQDTLGAWLIRCRPSANPELARSLREGDTEPVTRWCVADNYRSRMMAPGDRVVLWVSGDGRQLARGIWGLGRVAGAVRTAADTLEVPLHLPLLASGIAAEVVAAAAPDLEVMRQPQGSNPSWVSREQLAALSGLLGDWPAPA